MGENLDDNNNYDNNNHDDNHNSSDNDVTGPQTIKNGNIRIRHSSLKIIEHIWNIRRLP